MKKPKTLEQFFETQTDAQKETLLQLRLAAIKIKQTKQSNRKNPFEKIN